MKIGPGVPFLGNFLKEFGLKFFFQNFNFFFISKDSQKIGLSHPRTAAPYMHPYGAFCHFSFFENWEKSFFSKIFQKFRFLCLWVHILGVSVRAQKLQYVAYNIFRSQQKRFSTSKVMINQKLRPIWANLVRIFRGVFWRLVLWVVSLVRSFLKNDPLGPIFTAS